LPQTSASAPRSFLKKIAPPKEVLLALLPLFIAFLLYSELGENLWRTKGHYHARRFSYLLVAWLLFWAFNLKSRIMAAIDKEVLIEWAQKALHLVLIYFFYKTARDPRVIYIESESINSVLKVTSLFCAFGNLYLFFNPYAKNAQTLIRFFLSILFSQKIMVLFGSPNPLIDVFTSNTQGAQYFLKGINPYGASYQDIYAGKYDYAPGYVYWPVVVYLQSAFYYITNDIRWAHNFCDLLTLVALLKIFIPRRVGLLMTLLWFALPTQNFVFEQAWIDPILVCATAWTFYFLREKNLVAAGLLLGIAVATKQYAGIMAILIGFSVLLNSGFGSFFKLTGYSLLSFLVLILPLFYWNPQAFIEMTVKVPLAQEFRYDSFSLAAILIKNYGFSASGKLFTIIPLVGLLLSLVVIKVKRNLPLGLFLCFSLIFFFGKQAFCNYYYYLSFYFLLYLGFEYEKLYVSNKIRD
jgi:hypothetical protein